jgi:hypothetical protein
MMKVRLVDGGQAGSRRGKWRVATAVLLLIALVVAAPCATTTRSSAAAPALSASQGGSAMRRAAVLDVLALLRSLPAQRARSDVAGDSFAAPELAAAVSGYKRFGIEPLTLPRTIWPYARSTAVARVDTGVKDSSGIRMAVVDGRLVNHPVAQALYGLENFESFVITKDTFFLTRARAHADRLIATRQAAGSAWFYPYRWDFAPHSQSQNNLAAPWYSAMAQGLALSLFTRLYEQTGASGYRTAANATWLSFGVVRSTSRPWVSYIDVSGYLWLEEYADYAPRLSSDRTVNGHLFALFGLWDYWRLTRSASVAALFDGAATTVRAYNASIRTVNWVSRYCLNHVVYVAEYHYIVGSQLQTLFGMTGNVAFARLMDDFRADYPKPSLSRAIQFKPGTYRLYRFDARGQVVAARTLTFAQASQASGNLRQRIKGRGIYYHISAGGLRDWWVAESPGHAVMLGTYLHIGYLYGRTVRLPAGTHRAYAFDSAGRQTNATTYSSTTPTAWQAARSGYFAGVLYYRISFGALAGYWLPAASITVT